MNLPYPFESARGLEPDAFGRIALVNGDGVTLTHIPLEAAYELTPECDGASGCSGYGFRDGFGDSCDGSGFGDGFGDGYGYGFGSGPGYGFGSGRGSGEGRGK